MNEPEHAILARYVRTVADRIGLRDWDLRLLTEPTVQDGDGKVLAHVDVVYGRRYAALRVCEDFRDERPDDQRNTIVHELLHCHLDPPAAVIRCDLYGMRRLVESEYAAIKSAHHRAIEHATDALAHVIASTLPLIDWPPAPAAPSSARVRCRQRCPSDNWTDEDAPRCTKPLGHDEADGHLEGTFAWCGAVKTGMEVVITCGLLPRHHGSHYDPRHRMAW